MTKFNFESSLEAKGFEWEPILAGHQFLETENGYRLDFRVCEDQLIRCYQDRADGTIMFELENVPKSQEEFDAFWQEHRSMGMIEGLESGEDKTLE